MQAQILDLLERLRERARPGAVPDQPRPRRAGRDVRPDRDHVRGAIVETGPVEALFGWPEHPYTTRLIAAAGGRRERGLATPSPAGRPRRRVPGAARFRPRCPHAQAHPLGSRCRSRSRPPARPLPLCAMGAQTSAAAGVTAEDALAAAAVGGARPRLHFRAGRAARAVDGVSSSGAERVLGMIGESAAGSRRSRGRCWGSCRHGRRHRVRRRPPGRQGRLRALRRRVQMIFQDPYQSLNPRQRVETIVTEPLEIQGVAASRGGAGAAALEDVGLAPAKRYWGPLPARALGRAAPARRDRRGAGALARAAGQRRAGLDARRVDPRQILHLLVELGRAAASACVHHPRPGDRQGAGDRKTVMYLGRIVEPGPTPK